MSLWEEIEETKAQMEKQHVTDIWKMGFFSPDRLEMQGPRVYLRNCLRTSFVTGSLSARSVWMLRVSSASSTSSSSSTARQDHTSDFLPQKSTGNPEKGGYTKEE